MSDQDKKIEDGFNKQYNKTFSEKVKDLLSSPTTPTKKRELSLEEKIKMKTAQKKQKAGR